MTIERDAVLEVFIGRHGDAWRLYCHEWAPPYVRQKLDTNGEAFPVPEPDLQLLDAHMFGLDAPYSRKVAVNGDVELSARGRSAIVLGEWIDEFLTSGTL